MRSSRHLLAGDGEQHARSAPELFFKQRVDAVAKAVVIDERGVEARDGEVGLGERKLDIANHVDEEREAAHHLLKEVEAIRRVVRKQIERVADTEVRGHDVARLHPPEDPRDSAEVGERALACGGFVPALGGARADARVLELGDGCGLLEVVEDVRVVEDVLLIEAQ